MSLAVAFDDADTGEEIIWFMRRGRPYLFLRDAKTKRFIKKLDNMELRVFMEVEYSEEEAKKGNPLYVDAVLMTLVSPKEVPDMSAIEEELIARLEIIVAEKFGSSVAFELLTLRGIEYGSEPQHTEKHEMGDAYYVLVWKHHLKDEPRKEEERTKL